MSILDTIKSLFCGSPAEKEVEPVVAAEVVAKKPEPAPVVEKEPEPAPVVKQAPKPVAAKAPAVKEVSLQIPEDSTLRRHFISALQVEIEAGMPPRPTDSSLKRHYDATVQAELDNLLG